MAAPPIPPIRPGLVRTGLAFADAVRFGVKPAGGVAHAIVVQRALDSAERTTALAPTGRRLRSLASFVA